MAESKQLTGDVEQVRESVSRAYAKAVTRTSLQVEESQGSCCAAPAPNAEDTAGGCCSAPAQKGTVVKLAGYEDGELSALPPEAVVNSFGCGNPLAYSQVQTGDTVLDLGSGAGIDLLIAAKKVGPSGRAIGVDMTDEMIAKGRRNVAEAGLTNVEIRKGIIEHMPVDDATVDWVISNCVINLSPEKPKVFAEIARVLKPGGQMLVSDIVVEELPDWIRQSEVLYASCVSGAISEADYLDGLRQAGLTDVEVRGRIVYDTSQLKGLVKSEVAIAEPAIRELVAAKGEGFLRDTIASLVGKVYSALIYARKPQA